MVELLFSKGTGELSAFLNSVENLNTSAGIFQKVALLKISEVPVLTKVLDLTSAACNATKNELLPIFLKAAS